MKLTALVCGVAVGGLLALGQAQAADLLYSQPAPSAAPAYGGPYFGAKIGAVWTDEITGDFDGVGSGRADTFDFDTGFNASISAGYAFGGRWGMLSPRLEVEAGYQSSDVDAALDGGTATAAAATGELNAFYWFANLLLDIPMGWGFTPFVGAGAGFANVRGDNINVPVAGTLADGVNDSDTTFAWNVTTGLSYDISRNVTLDLAYRFVQFNSVDFRTAVSGVTVSNDIDNHQVNVGVRVHL